MGMSSSKNKKKENEKKLEKEKTENKENKDNKKGKDNVKKIKNILSDKAPKGNNDFDVLFIVDATGSMANYIHAAKEETQNISEDLRQAYPEMKFKYGYIFYRDPIDSKSDIHEIIDLTDNVNSLPGKISKIRAYGGGDMPEDWVGAYKIANGKISWRNGVRIIIHLADAGAHGKLFTSDDNYPEEENKLINELEKCIEKKIDIFGYVILEESRKSFEECSKIYRNKGGSYEILNFFQNTTANYALDAVDYGSGIRRSPGGEDYSKREEGEFQREVNRNFRMNAVRNVADRMKRREEESK